MDSVGSSLRSSPTAKGLRPSGADHLLLCRRPSGAKTAALAALCAFVAGASSPSLPAASKYWDGSDGSWTTGTWRLTSPTGAATTLPVAADWPYIESGRVTVAAGGTGVFAQLRVGSTAGLSGTVRVNGFLNGSGANYVGLNGTGVLDIAQTGTMNNGSTAIANYTGASGTAIVAGLWTNSGELRSRKNIMWQIKASPA